MSLITIGKDKKTVRIRINPVFYPREYIEEACKDFEALASIRMSTHNGMVYLTLKPKKKVDLNTLGFEFMNYILGLSKKSGI